MVENAHGKGFRSVFAFRPVLSLQRIQTHQVLEQERDQRIGLGLFVDYTTLLLITSPKGKCFDIGVVESERLIILVNGLYVSAEYISV